MFFKVVVRRATLLKETPTQVFSCEYYEIFKSNFFYRTPPVVAFMSTRKGRRGERGRNERGKIFQLKEENENFYQQILVLAITEMQIQLYKY